MVPLRPRQRFETRQRDRPFLAGATRTANGRIHEIRGVSIGAFAASTMEGKTAMAIPDAGRLQNFRLRSQMTSCVPSDVRHATNGEWLMRDDHRNDTARLGQHTVRSRAQALASRSGFDAECPRTYR